MQISRHWRLNALRYRLEGVRYNDGNMSVQERPEPISQAHLLNEEAETDSQKAKAEVAA